MRKALWSSAALVMLLSVTAALSGPIARAADGTVAMGSSNEPLKFLPPEITVPVGGTVEWRNDTDFQHDVVADDGSFKSGKLLNKGEKYEFKFTKAGEFSYICTPHESAGMKGVVRVTGGAPTPAPTVATTATTAASGTTATTAAAPSSTTTTTSKAAAGGSTTTTTAGGGVTSTTQAASTTPTSAPETAGVTDTTAPAGAPADGAESAAGDRASEGGSEKPQEGSSPIGIAFAGVSTVLLVGISGKLLASKS